MKSLFTLILIVGIVWAVITPEGRQTAGNCLYLARAGARAAASMINVTVLELKR